MAIAIDTVKAALGAAPVLVVTSADAAPLFSAMGVDVVPDRGEGLNKAIALGISFAGPGPIAVLLGDLPALAKEELASALDHARRYPRAMVADADGRGTTLITAVRGWTHMPAFGPGSRDAHLLAGYQEIILSPASGLRCDVDTADQLNFLAGAGRLGSSTGSVFGGTPFAETAPTIPWALPNPLLVSLVPQQRSEC